MGNDDTKLVSGIFYIKMPNQFSSDEITKLNSESESWIHEDVKVYVLDFKSTTSLSSSFYRFLSKFTFELNTESKKVISVNISKSLLEIIMKDGVERIFNVSELKKKNLNTSKNSNAEIVRQELSICVKAQLETNLTESLNIATPSKHEKIKLEEYNFKNYPYVAILKFFNDDCHGDIRLGMDALGIMLIYQLISKKAVESFDPKYIEYVKEYLNILSGKAKKDLFDKVGISVKIDVPEYVNLEKMMDFFKLKNLKLSEIYAYDLGAAHLYLNVNLS